MSKPSPEFLNWLDDMQGEGAASLRAEHKRQAALARLMTPEQLGELYKQREQLRERGSRGEHVGEMLLQLERQLWRGTGRG